MNHSSRALSLRVQIGVRPCGQAIHEARGLPQSPPGLLSRVAMNTKIKLRLNFFSTSVAISVSDEIKRASGLDFLSDRMSVLLRLHASSVLECRRVFKAGM